MPWDALPPHLNQPEDWIGKDNDRAWYMKWEKYVKGWFAFGPWSNHSWAKWQFPPREIFKIGGKGEWRYESVNALYYDPLVTCARVLSRCQYYKRWHFAVLWPLQIQFHIYWRKKDVPIYGQPWVNNFDITKLLFMYGPIHWDADLVYWILSFYVGGQWK